VIRISIATEAFEAIISTLPLGTVAYEADPTEQGQRHVWLEDAMVDRLGVMRGAGDATASSSPSATASGPSNA
jgi:hypothetical protein